LIDNKLLRKQSIRIKHTENLQPWNINTKKIYWI
jgi:hypothetical protein